MGSGNVDLRFATPLAKTGACDAPPGHGALGIADPRIIAPGDPARSVLLARIRDPGSENMPPGAGFLIDQEGVALIVAWIGSLAHCD